MRTRRFELVWFFLLLVFSPAAAQDKPADRIQIERDIVFGKGGGQELKLDLARPRSGDGPFPAVVCIHGGGWKGGSYKDLSERNDLIQKFAANGHVAVTIQYRLTPKAQFPAQVEDCKCAVRWLRANAPRLKVNPDRIGAIGFSAGGHLVCMLGLTNGEDGLEGNGDLEPASARLSSRVRAVVDFFGPADLTLGDWDPRLQPLLSDFLGGTLEEKRENYRRASPVTYIRKDPANASFLIFHGTEDAVVRYQQSVILLKALEKVGTPAELVTMKGENHGWSGDKLEDSLKRTMAFFDRELKAGK